jgi:hypothetical protein
MNSAVFTRSDDDEVKETTQEENSEEANESGDYE